MKKLYTLLTLATLLVAMSSCGDDYYRDSELLGRWQMISVIENGYEYELEIGEYGPVAAVVSVVQNTQCDTVTSHFKLQLVEVHALREAVGSGFHVVGVVLGVVVSPPAPATTIGRPASTVVVVGELFGIGAF